MSDITFEFETEPGDDISFDLSGDSLSLPVPTLADAGKVPAVNDEGDGYELVVGGGGGGSGDVVGPASSVDGRAVLFDGTTGKLVKQASAAPVLEGDARLVDPTGATAGHVWTANGADGASWASAGGDITTDAAWAAKGDLIVASADNTASVLTVGADDTILMADSGEANGVKWANAATTRAALNLTGRAPRRTTTVDYGFPYVVTTSSPATQAHGADNLFFGPYFAPPTDITITGLCVRYTVMGSAGSLIRLGIYSLPGSNIQAQHNLVSDCGTVPGDTTAPVSVALTGLSVALTAGTVYAFGFVHNSASSITFVRYLGQPIGGLMGDVLSNTNVLLMSGAQSYGALPATFTPTATTGTAVGCYSYIAATWTGS